MIKGAEAPNFILLINPTSNYYLSSPGAAVFLVDNQDQSYSAFWNTAFDLRPVYCTKDSAMEYYSSGYWPLPSSG